MAFVDDSITFVAAALGLVFFSALAISGTILFSLMSVFLPNKGDDLASLSICTLSFQPMISLSTGASPFYIDNADLNNDTVSDLIVANFKDGTISTFLGNTDGSFQSPTTSSTGGIHTQPNAFAIGDIDKDGRLDIVIANSGTGTVITFHGNGDGTITPQTLFSTGFGSAPLDLALGYLDDDGNLDLVASDSNNHVVLVFFGNSSGNFMLSQTLFTGNGSIPCRVVIKDFNRDGRSDIAVVNSGTYNAGIFLNNGGGQFTDQSTYPTGSMPVSLMAVDLNKDGIFDLVTANYRGNTISVLLGNGGGTFKKQKTFSTGLGSIPISVSSSDLNNDKNVDIIVANYGTNNIGVFLGNGHGNFKIQRIYPTGYGSYPHHITIADFNSDGRLDVISANSGKNSAGILLSTCS
ncbi:unnamed protein product [Adineta ricciae]|uniref:VCBS repeat-containing protein n=1 Tax=Adineta ricciae TaxID=249248 RepID=A0A814RP37_ADIRI|nr:unnamed protein product [Adineta ricciae]